MDDMLDELADLFVSSTMLLPARTQDHRIRREDVTLLSCAHTDMCGHTKMSSSNNVPICSTRPYPHQRLRFFFTGPSRQET